ncbi:MAG: hypothetical protein ACTSRN_07920 [Alphaproteobacteria bacterium]
MFNILKILVLTAFLATPFSALASGGDDPVPGIDIIIKEAGLAGQTVSFSKTEIAAVNEVKGMERPALIAKIAARYVAKYAKDANPEGGWYRVLSKGLTADWCLECQGGETAIKAMVEETGKTFVVIIRMGSEG